MRYHWPMVSDPAQLGGLIRVQREQRGLTQAQLGEAVGAQLGRHIRRELVSQWEHGRRVPADWRTIAAIGAALGLAFVLGANARTLVAVAAGGAIAAIALEAANEAARMETEARVEGEARPRSGRPVP